MKIGYQKMIYSMGDNGDAEAYFEFETMVSERIRKAGYDVHHQVDCFGYPIDLAVVDPRQDVTCWVSNATVQPATFVIMLGATLKTTPFPCHRGNTLSVGNYPSPPKVAAPSNPALR